MLPHRKILSNPTVESIREELDAEVLNKPVNLHTPVEDVVVGAMGAQNAMKFFKKGVLLITPGDREDILLAACTSIEAQSDQNLAGIVFTGGLRPPDDVLKVIRSLPIPVLLAQEDSYLVASAVHDLTVKTRPDDLEKISLIRDLLAQHVNVKRIVEALK